MQQEGGMGGVGGPPNQRLPSRSNRNSEREDMSNRSVRWRVVEVGPTTDVLTHISDEYNLVCNVQVRFSQKRRKTRAQIHPRKI